MTIIFTNWSHLDGSIELHYPCFADGDRVNNGVFGFGCQRFIPDAHSKQLENCFQGLQTSLRYWEFCWSCLDSCLHVSFSANASCFQFWHHLVLNREHWRVRPELIQFQRLEILEDLNQMKHRPISSNPLSQSFFVFAFRCSLTKHSRLHSAQLSYLNFDKAQNCFGSLFCFTCLRLPLFESPLVIHSSSRPGNSFLLINCQYLCFFENSNFVDGSSFDC